MNTASTTVAPEVQEFLAAVRAQLADLDAEEQRDILDGLEADLTDLVAERGRGALGDPVAYAHELRLAAGLGETARRTSRPVRSSVAAFLDACHARFDALVARLPWDASPLLAWLRPLWWVARAWLAVQLVDWVGRGYPGSYFDVLPNLRGTGWLVMIAAIATSVQIGRGRWWPGGHRGVLARLVLIALNVFAVLVAFPTFDRTQGNGQYWDGFQAGMEQVQSSTGQDGLTPIDEQAGVYAHGKWVSNIYPYDAKGRPLAGVQLFDQAGRPIKVVTKPDCEPTPTDPRPQAEPGEDGSLGYCGDLGFDTVLPRVSYPWSNGAAQLFNVFPLPSRIQADPEPTATAFAEGDKPAIGQFPMATVPPASLPGIKTGVQHPAG